MTPPQVRGNAASAIAANAKGGSVRLAAIGVNAAKVRFPPASTSLQDLWAMFKCIGLIDEPEQSFLRTQSAKRSENTLNHRLWN